MDLLFRLGVSVESLYYSMLHQPVYSMPNKCNEYLKYVKTHAVQYMHMLLQYVMCWEAGITANLAT